MVTQEQIIEFVQFRIRQVIVHAGPGRNDFDFDLDVDSEIEAEILKHHVLRDFWCWFDNYFNDLSHGVATLKDSPESAHHHADRFEDVLLARYRYPLPNRSKVRSEKL